MGAVGVSSQEPVGNGVERERHGVCLKRSCAPSHLKAKGARCGDVRVVGRVCGASDQDRGVYRELQGTDVRCCESRKLSYGVCECVLQNSEGGRVRTLEVIERKLVCLFGAAIVAMQPLVDDGCMV